MANKTLKQFSKPMVFFDGAKSIPAWDVDDLTGWTVLSDGGTTSREAQLFASVPWFYRGVKSRSNNVGKMPFAVLNGDEEVDSSTNYQNALEFLPNPTSLFKKVEMSLAVTGKAYIRKEVNSSGYIKKMRFLVPTSIKEHYDDNGEVDYYERRVGGKEFRLKPAEIVAIYDPDFTTENGPPTSSAGMAALASAGVLFNVDRFVSNYFERGAIKATIFTTKNLGIEDAKTFKAWFNDMMTGISNAFTTRILNADEVKPVVIGEGLEALESPTLTTERRQNIATALGVPESRMWSAAANYATSHEDTVTYYEDTIIPECDLIAEAFKTQVFIEAHHLEGYDLDFQYETLPIFKTDAAEQAGALQQLKNAGVPLLMAMDLLGFDLTDDQRKELEALMAGKEERAEALTDNLTQGRGAEEALQGEPIEQEAQPMGNPQEMRSALAAYKRKALYGMKKNGNANVEFVTSVLPAGVVDNIATALQACTNEDEVKVVFAGVDVEAKAEPAPVIVEDDDYWKYAIINRACDLMELIHAN